MYRNAGIKRLTLGRFGCIINIATKERTMLKLIGIVVVAYLGWVTGVIQATLMVTAGVLIAIAGA